MILIEFSKLVYPWEKDFIKSFNYFVNNYIQHIACLTKTEEDKNLERWFFFLEIEEFVNEIKKNLPHLHKLFLKNKVKDLKLGECIDTTSFIKMSKEIKLIPVFLSTKEVVNVMNNF
jgi:hypothetical protein